MHRRSFGREYNCDKYNFILDGMANKAHNLMKSHIFCTALVKKQLLALTVVASNIMRTPPKVSFYRSCSKAF